MSTYYHQTGPVVALYVDEIGGGRQLIFVTHIIRIIKESGPGLGASLVLTNNKLLLVSQTFDQLITALNTVKP